ncbi:inositol transporter-like SP family MFS transporter [Novosphingobium chloroacetimidivorans]|uniref:Inositol transporter-like SP family MFS transporter n=1 Tax=Novosphingobium chloroacetimidivorans TaxID=1428314 RepID=A0A7W7KB77_9SPHN|nr:MFS transporter [Novosphingobium chloroacetimidivorans]MBB4858873.1 inositol transporter-like SP family MFS transporter [Novosphingobium chloroacetimidivorans]
MSAGGKQQNWRDTILAGLANYIDAGSIVAGSAALALWQESYHLTNSSVGLIAAFGPNAIGAGVGALVGGWLCDKIGRKKIYQWDMLLYAAGMSLLVFAVAPWMIVTGFLIVGLAVGADIPASWSLIAEQAPDDARGKHSGVAQVLWYLGPVVVLLMSLALTSLGILGARLVFAHLLVIALGLTLLRSKMHESRRWEESQRSDAPRLKVSELFRGRYLTSILGLVGMYGFWNLWSGTNGFFFPYILRTVGAATQAQSVAIQAVSFFVGMVSIYFVFMRLSDKVNQRTLFIVSAVIQVIGMALLALFPLTIPIALLHVFLLQFGGGFGAQSFFQLWSSEQFPTALRATAQGVCFAVVRIALGIFSFFVPMLNATGFTNLAWILTGFLVVSGLVGAFWAPRNQGKSLEQLEAEQRAA